MEENPCGGGGYVAGRQELVYERLGGVTGRGREERLIQERGKRIGVYGEEVSEVEGVGNRLFDGDGLAGFEMLDLWES